MKYINRITICFALCFILPMCIGIGPAFGLSNEEIFGWVTGQLKIDGAYPMPTVNLVSQSELQTIYRNRTARSYKRLAAAHGEKKAEEIMDDCLKNVIGLFVPETQKLYVGRFLEPSKRDSIVAHEFTHYFQFVQDGPLDPRSANADLKYLFNEMQASMIENEFKRTFSGEFNPDGNTTRGK